MYLTLTLTNSTTLLLKELAILDSGHVRPVNITSLGSADCFVLSRNEFNTLMKTHEPGLQSTLLNSYKNKKDSKKNMNEQKKHQEGQRRISVYDEDGVVSKELSRVYLKKICTFMAESLYLNQYWKFFRHMVLQPHTIPLFGPQAKFIMRNLSTREKAVMAIMHHTKHILVGRPGDRSPEDLQFIVGVLKQKSEFVSKYCNNWTNKQWTLLAKKVKLFKAEPLCKIVEAGTDAYCAYLVLKGSARIFSPVVDPMTKRKHINYENDVFAGDLIGESALGGIGHNIQNAITITPCELLVIGVSDYKSVAELGSRPILTINEKYLFIKQLPLFENYAEYPLFCLAQALQASNIAKDVVCVKKNEECEELSFIYNGKMDIVSDLDNKSPIASLQKYDYFGESSILRKQLLDSERSSAGNGKNKKRSGGRKKDDPSKSAIQSSYHFRECFNCKAASSLEVLTLPRTYFYLIDSNKLNMMRSSYISRMKWRMIRADTVRDEMDSETKSSAALVLTESSKKSDAHLINSFSFDNPSPINTKSTFGKWWTVVLFFYVIIIIDIIYFT